LNKQKGVTIIAKNMQLPIPFVVDLFRLIHALRAYELDNETRVIATQLEKLLRAKMEARERRNAFAAYKASPPGERKEAARQKYLELAGTRDDGR